MKKILFLSVAVFIFLIPGSFNLKSQSLITPPKRFVRGIPFPKPENLAQEVTNDIIMNRKTKVNVIDWELKYGTATYYYRYYSDKGEIYDVQIGIFHGIDVYQKGFQELRITYYSTNRKFNNLSSTDVIAQELLSNPPEIYAIATFYDVYIDGTIDVYNSFNKYSKGIWHGFTLKEKEDGKRGIQQYSFVDGKVLKKRMFRKTKLVAASTQEIESINLQYKNILQALKGGF